MKKILILLAFILPVALSTTSSNVNAQNYEQNAIESFIIGTWGIEVEGVVVLFHFEANHTYYGLLKTAAEEEEDEGYWSLSGDKIIVSSTDGSKDVIEISRIIDKDNIVFSLDGEEIPFTRIEL